MKEKPTKERNLMGFWNICVPDLTNEHFRDNERIILEESNKVMRNDPEVSETCKNVCETWKTCNN